MAIHEDKFIYKHNTGPTYGEIWYTSTGRKATPEEAAAWEPKYIAQLAEQFPGQPLIVSVDYLEPLPPSREIRGFSPE